MITHRRAAHGGVGGAHCRGRQLGPALATEATKKFSGGSDRPKVAGATTQIDD